MFCVKIVSKLGAMTVARIRIDNSDPDLTIGRYRYGTICLLKIPVPVGKKTTGKKRILNFGHICVLLLVS